MDPKTQKEIQYKDLLEKLDDYNITVSKISSNQHFKALLNPKKIEKQNLVPETKIPLLQDESIKLNPGSLFGSWNLNIEPQNIEKEIFSYIEDEFLKQNSQMPKIWQDSYQRSLPIEIDISEIEREPYLPEQWMDVKWKRNPLDEIVESIYEEDFVVPKDKTKTKLSTKKSTNNYDILLDKNDPDNFLSSKETNTSQSEKNENERIGNEGIHNWPEIWEMIQDESSYFTKVPGLSYGLDKNSLEEGVYANSISDIKSMDTVLARYEGIEEQNLYGLEKIDNMEISDINETKDDAVILENSYGENGGSDKNLSITLENQSLESVLEKHSKSLTENKLDSQNQQWAIEVDLSDGGKTFDLEIEKPAIEYDFVLDPFQKEAVLRLERSENVFVAAHTSAGKTVVAEYAIALSKIHMMKTIYTSPIKALSNQKYRDFCKKFGSDQIGIITGDIQIRPEAPCVVMTTEVLRSMLYEGSDMLRDVEFVIFDEVHYVNDSERGVVWEEVIIMLPDHITLVMLSATVPNTKEFSEWIGRTKKSKVYVIKTLKRPVPLEHFLYLSNVQSSKSRDDQLRNKGFFKIVDKSGNFDSYAYRDAFMEINKKPEFSKSKVSDLKAKFGQGNGKQQDESKNKFKPKVASGTNSKMVQSAISKVDQSQKLNSQHGGTSNLWTPLINQLRSLDLLPCVFFVFSRKKCESYLYSLTNIDFLTQKQKSQVHLFIKSSLTRLSENDLKLPQIKQLTWYLMRGIGTHHSGLLPILKEIVELLFANNFIKVLFATETFAMGVNMPAKSVVFTGLRKNDGTSFRDLSSGEYTQMSGRAGRRGLDNTGVVIIANPKNELYDSATLNSIILGSPNKLESQFKLTYAMILNLLRSNQIRVEQMIRDSFSEDANMKNMPLQNKAMEATQKELGKLPEINCILCQSDLDEFYSLSLKLTKSNYSLYTFILNFINSDTSSIRSGSSRNTWKNPFSVGRLIVIYLTGIGHTLAYIIPHHTKNSINGSFVLDTSLTHSERKTIDTSKSEWVIVQLAVDKNILSKYKESAQSLTDSQFDESFRVLNKQITPSFPVTGNWVSFINNSVEKTVDLSDIELVSMSIPVSAIVEVTSYTAKSTPNSVSKYIQGLVEYSETLVESNKQSGKFDFMKVSKSMDYISILKRKNSLMQEIKSYECLFCTDFLNHYGLKHCKFSLENNLELLKHELSEGNLDLIPEYNNRLGVLLRLGYIDEQHNVTIKGRVASQINTCNELILTEMILNNSFSNYNEYEIVAVLSGFVCQVNIPNKESFYLSRPYEEEDEDADLDFPDAVYEGIESIKGLVSTIVALQNEFHIPSNEEDYIKEFFNFNLAHLVYKWAQGTSFHLLSELAGDIQEGLIVRTILRLNENILEVTNAARILGNYELCEKLKKASTLIKRDIVFAASLYY
ncbi:hypothetical protein BB559_002930 [Furculomyces boomerangus]|uniref:Antiviral helicase SKI2 n=1 Tax=Furculomyces boomerangus TaxID=61424 RepID=A0A2T9YR13_9FUNG|nr:hypothetical protein BB559_002930 [Furculomyces boomerangus]